MLIYWFGSPPASRRGGWLPLLLLAVETPTAWIVMTQAGPWGPAFKMPLKDVQRRTWCYPPLSGEGGVLPVTQCLQEGYNAYPPFRGHIPTRGRLHERVRGGQEVAP